MLNKELRKDLKDVIDCNEFIRFYRIFRNVYHEKVAQQHQIRELMRVFFKEIRNILEYSEYGIHLKDFGVFVPKDTEIYTNNEGFGKKSLFTKVYRIRQSYRFYFEEEYYEENFKFVVRVAKKKKRKASMIRTPNPDLVLYHRKRIRKDNTTIE